MNEPEAFLESIKMLNKFAKENGYRLIGTLILTKEDSQAWVQKIDSDDTNSLQ
jgi:hypothetical protein